MVVQWLERPKLVLNLELLGAVTFRLSAMVKSRFAKADAS
jgi:hypothetical protein